MVTVELHVRVHPSVDSDQTVIESPLQSLFKHVTKGHEACDSHVTKEHRACDSHVTKRHRTCDSMVLNISKPQENTKEVLTLQMMSSVSRMLATEHAPSVT